MTISDFSIPEQLTSCRVLANANLNAIYASLVPGSGIGATLTNAGAPGALVIDSVVLEVGDRVAVYAQTNSAQDGIYDVIAVGDASNRWVLERSPDFQVNSQMRPGLYFSISGGNDFGGEVVVVVEPVPAVVGVDPIFLQKVSVAGSGTAANKDVTDNSQPLVASVKGAFVVGDIIIAADTLGTSEDSGVPISALVNPLTTKGDLFTYSTMGARLPIGANGTVLESDSTQATGNGWTSFLKDSSLTNSVAYQLRELLYSDGTTIILNWLTQQLFDNTGVQSQNWTSRQLFSSTNVLSVDYTARHLVASDGTTVNFDWSNPAGPVLPGYLRSANNLSDVANALTSFNNISPLTTKGDLLSHDTTNNVRVPVGTNGALVNADSTASPGVAWVTQLQDASLVRSVAYQVRQLYTAANNLSLDWNVGTLVNTTGQIVANWQTQVLNDAAALLSINWNSRVLENTSGNPSLNWQTDVLNDTTGALSANWNSRHLVASDGSTISIDYSSPSNVRVGGSAGVTAQGTAAVAIGFQAGNNTQGDNGIAIGNSSGLTDQGAQSVAIGTNAGNANQGTESVAIGIAAGATSQGTGAVAIGVSAGAGSQGNNAIAIGEGAGATSQGANSIAIGNTAAGSNQPANTVAVGASTSVTGAGSTAIGYAARDDSFTNSIALGSNATNTANNQAILPVGVTWTTSSLPIGINPGTINQAAVYAAAGTILSGSNVFFDATSVSSLNFFTRLLNDAAGLASVNWNLRHLIASDGTTINIDWSNPAGPVIPGYLKASNNLSDVSNALTSFNNISPLTTTGDLLSHNATNNVRVPVGANGTVIQADSGNANGLEWTPALKDASLVGSVAYQTRQLLASDGTTVAINWNDPANTVVNPFLVAEKGLKLPETANGRQGQATLVAGVATVANTSITANSRIELTKADFNSVGFLYYTLSAGVSFTINSNVLTDNGVITYVISEPA